MRYVPKLHEINGETRRADGVHLFAYFFLLLTGATEFLVYMVLK